MFRALAAADGGPGPPEAIWASYRDECGPLEQMSDDCLRELYGVHCRRAWGAGVTRLEFPPEIEARLVNGKPPGRRRGKPERSFFQRRFEQEVISAVAARKEALKVEGFKADEALEIAAAEIAAVQGVARELLEDWVKHPGRRRRRRVRARRI